MKKNLLIGSIISVAILILVSFTSVVGYRSITSDVKASPLFTIRSNRAIDEDSRDFSCEYVGDGEQIKITIPVGDNRRELQFRVVNIISKMKDKEIKKIILILIDTHNEKILGNENTNDVQITPFKLRDRSSRIGIFLDEKEKATLTWHCPTLDCKTLDAWVPGCNLVLILLLLLFTGIQNIISYFTTYAVPCFTENIV
jgi:hypothetical protein